MCSLHAAFRARQQVSLAAGPLGSHLEGLLCSAFTAAHPELRECGWVLRTPDTVGVECSLRQIPVSQGPRGLSPALRCYLRGTSAATQFLNRVSLGFVVAENPGWASGKPYSPAPATPGCARPEACQVPALPHRWPGLRVPLLLFLQLHRPCVPPASLSLPIPCPGQGQGHAPCPGSPELQLSRNHPPWSRLDCRLGSSPFSPEVGAPQGRSPGFGSQLSHLLALLPHPPGSGLYLTEPQFHHL